MVSCTFWAFLSDLSITNAEFLYFNWLLNSLKLAGVDTHGILLFRTLIGKVELYFLEFLVKWWGFMHITISCVSCSLYFVDIWKYWFGRRWPGPWQRRSSCTHWCLYCFTPWTSRHIILLELQILLLFKLVNITCVWFGLLVISNGFYCLQMKSNVSLKKLYQDMEFKSVNISELK